MQASLIECQVLARSEMEAAGMVGVSIRATASVAMGWGGVEWSGAKLVCS